MARRPDNPRRDGGDVVPPPHDQPAAAQEKSDLKRPGFYVNILTLIVIGVYTFFACSQVKETQTANSIAKKALAEANKPYVMFSTLFPNHSVDRNGPHIRVGFTLTNLGNTPASYVRFYNCDPIIVGSGVSPNFKCNLTENPSDPMVLGPKQPVNFAGSIIKESDLEQTREDKTNIYVLGYVTYQDSISRDRFDNPEQRETRFCQKIQSATVKTIKIPSTPAPAGQSSVVPPEPPEIQPSVLIAPIAGNNCPTFNCIDDGCTGKP